MDQLRPLQMVRSFTTQAPGSVLIRWGRTHVLCTACWEEGVPKWREGSGSGWLTAEYDMLPAATHERRQRNRTKVDGRTQEIQRLVGRVLRSAVDFERLGENTITIDCDVLQADGGTRTAAITGAYVALCDAVRHAQREKKIKGSPIVESVAAVSVGRLGKRLLLDLDYQEDVAAEVDLNVAMTGQGKFIEVQGTGEEASFTRKELDAMLKLAENGIKELSRIQERTLRRRLKS